MSNEYGLSESSLQQIINTFENFPQIQQVVLFGSRAMGNYKSGSDIDIALKGNIDFELMAKIQSILEDELPLPYFFDVINYEHLNNEKLKKHIDTYGKVLYSQTTS